MKIAQLQLAVFADKQKNLDQLAAWMDAHCRDDKGKPDLISLGEMFNCPYVTENFPVYAEEEGGQVWKTLSNFAKEYGVYLSSGTVPELGQDGKVYNTAYVFNREGEQIAKNRKMHLFSLKTNGGRWFRESDTLGPGNEVTVFDTEFGRAGICVCFDCRFPELIRLMVLKGAQFILVPAAFNNVTGPAHWEVMLRSRAIDNQCWVMGTSPALTEDSPYKVWGHSMVVSPWGEVVSELGRGPEWTVTDVDLKKNEEVREKLPLLSSRREDVYELREK